MSTHKYWKNKEVKFEEDDRVVCLVPYNANNLLIGQTGRIITISNGMALIRFDHHINGSYLDGRGLIVPANKETLRKSKAGEVSEAPPKPIMIGTYKVENFNTDGFNVGCLKITWKTFVEIAKRRPK